VTLTTTKPATSPCRSPGFRASSFTGHERPRKNVARHLRSAATEHPAGWATSPRPASAPRVKSATKSGPSASDQESDAAAGYFASAGITEGSRVLLAVRPGHDLIVGMFALLNWAPSRWPSTPAWDGPPFGLRPSIPSDGARRRPRGHPAQPPALGGLRHASHPRDRRRAPCSGPSPRPRRFLVRWPT
jgi:hypothetical protein